MKLAEIKCLGEKKGNGLNNSVKNQSLPDWLESKTQLQAAYNKPTLTIKTDI